MSFQPRQIGTTLRRVQEALDRPHDASERFDPDFRVALKCEACGALGYSPRKHVSDAVADHNSKCPAVRKAKAANEAPVTRLLYPRQ